MLRLMKRNSIKKAMSLVLAATVTVTTANLTILSMTETKVEAADAFENSIADFPASYKPYLRALHEKYPTWKFKAYETGIDFATAVTNEQSNSKSVMEKSYNDLLKSRAKGDYNSSTGAYIAKDGTSWVSASRNTVAYFMDPRNFLNEDFIAMFESLSYNADEQTQGGVEAILKGSFMYNTNVAWFNSNGVYKTTTGSKYLYSQRILDAAKKSGVSPYFIASKTVLEVGKASYNAAKYPGVGAGSSVNGMYPGYKGIFNFYNIGASDGTNAVARGLAWASTSTSNDKYQRPWNTPGKSIIGGAIYIGEKFISAGQDTTYFQRFNVKSGISYSTYTHQYMTSIYGNAAESYSTMNAYKSNNLMNTDKTFVIPVYKNMPGDNTQVTYGQAKKTGVASANVILRSEPDTASDMVIKLSTGDKVTVVDSVMTDVEYSVKWLNNPYWYKVTLTKSGKSYTGYISANYVKIDSEKNIIKGVKTSISTKLSYQETVFYESDNPAIATVDDDGNVTGVSTGSTTIRAYTANGNFSSCTVTVLDKGVELNKKSITVGRGNTAKLTATVYPSSASNKTVTWTSDDTSVASVSSTGKITAKAVGTTKIHCTANAGGVEAVCTVKVIELVTGVSIDAKELKLSVDDTYSLKAQVKPDNATNKTVKWTSDNKDVVTVSKGLVQALTPGIANVTVTTVNGKYTATAKVTVVPKATKLKVFKRGYDSLRISWDKVEGATGYRIYRKTTDGKWKNIKVVTADKLTYIDQGLKTGSTYEYTVSPQTRIIDTVLIGDKAESVSNTVVPAKPKISALTKTGTAAITVSWNQINGADGYTLYRKKEKDGEFQEITTITAPDIVSYRNKNLKVGTTYYYRLAAYKIVGKQKIYSNNSEIVSLTR